MPSRPQSVVDVCLKAAIGRVPDHPLSPKRCLQKVADVGLSRKTQAGSLRVHVVCDDLASTILKRTHESPTARVRLKHEASDGEQADEGLSEAGRRVVRIKRAPRCLRKRTAHPRTN